MKIQTTAILLMAGLLALLHSPVKAQDKPDAPPPAPPEKKEIPPSPGRPRGDMPSREPERPPERPVAYLGVLTGPVSPELRTQFGLAEGFGLQVAEVMPDSPAQEAGLKVHDVLVNLEDQKLVNMEQLQALVRSRKKDDTVTLTVITSGQQKQVSVKVGERMTRAENERPRGGFGPMMHPWAGGPFGQGGGTPDEWREKMDRYQREMREYQEHVQKWMREGRGGPMPQPPMFDSHRGGPEPRHHDMDMPGRGPRDGMREKSRREEEMERRIDHDHHERATREGGPRAATEEHRMERREHHESASVTRSDEGGIYRLSRDGERAVFSVKPRDGEAREWPVNTDEERAALPEPLRAKLRELEEIRRSAHPGQDHPGREPGAPPPRDRRPEGA